MTASRLLTLYPREWRERYGDEFVATAGDKPLSFFQVVDIVFAAVDARLSSDVRVSARSGRAAASTRGEQVMRHALSKVCAHSKHSPFTTRDSLMGAGP